MSDLKFSSEDDELIRRVIDQHVSPDEFEAFNERLRTDAKLRQRYILHADLEANLFEEFSQSKLSQPVVGPELTQRKQNPLYGVCVCLATLLLGVTTWIVVERQFLREPIQPTVSKIQPELPATETKSQIFTPYGLVGDDAAVVVRTEGVAQSELKVGARLKPGIIRIDSGELQLEFVGGAVLALAGPAELHIKSKDAATLVSGSANTRVPRRARGFVLNAPNMAIVDLGTEFGVRIDQSGTSEVEVTSGEVQLSLIGEDGNTLLSQLVGETESVRADGNQQMLLSIDSDRGALPKITSSDSLPLPVTEVYVDAILRENPDIYWRFESEHAGSVLNEVSSDWPARIHKNADKPDCIRIENGYVRFETAQDPRYLWTEQRLDTLNEGPYTIEFWMKPDHLKRSTCIGLFPDQDAHNHLTVLEIATETELIHEPGAIRFLHRNPPANSFRLGTNVYSKGVCVPGQWQHVVAVKTGQTLSLYFNGQLARQVSIRDADSDDAVRLIVGQLNITTTMRQFVGAIDEVAVYRHALQPLVIQNHYQLIASETKN